MGEPGFWPGMVLAAIGFASFIAATILDVKRMKRDNALDVKRWQEENAQRHHPKPQNHKVNRRRRRYL